jgi:hypothetical protein
MQSRYHGRQHDLEGVRFDRSIFRGLRYPKIAAVQVGRGCRYACDFCSIHAFYGSHVRHRPAREIAREIESTGRRHVLIVDDNIFNDRQKAAELFRELIPLGIRWGCQITIDIAEDAALLDLMARSGCIAALVGFESLDADNLRQMNKAWMLRRYNAATAVRSPSYACALVTSCTRWRSTYSRSGSPSARWTTWRSQTFSASVRGVPMRSMVQAAPAAPDLAAPVEEQDAERGAAALAG